MINRCNLETEERETAEDHLYKFAIQGLRTLVMGKKDLNYVF